MPITNYEASRQQYLDIDRYGKALGLSMSFLPTFDLLTMKQAIIPTQLTLMVNAFRAGYDLRVSDTPKDAEIHRSRLAFTFVTSMVNGEFHGFINRRLQDGTDGPLASVAPGVTGTFGLVLTAAAALVGYTVGRSIPSASEVETTNVLRAMERGDHSRAAE